MSKVLKVSSKDLIEQIKISCQMPKLIEGIATRKIITDAANKAGIKVEIEELQQTADNLRLAHKLIRAKDTWSWMEKHHLSLDDFEQVVYTNLLSNKLITHLFADRVETLLSEYQLDYAEAVTYEIIFDDEDLALELFDALKQGKISFLEVAHKHIQNPELRRKGGYQGILRYKDFKRQEIAIAVFNATPPQILKPIMTLEGVHLIWVEEVIQPKLDRRLRVKILEDLFTSWLQKQITELEIITQFEDETLGELVIPKSMLTVGNGNG
ncbi:MAG: peptidylprolyl isomerase [Rhizonema sp. NSF051]|nr:peptidylprolyl isomerase [Rhizonema sp. NSF051]